MCTLQVASLYMGKASDMTSFYEEFRKDNWQEVLKRYHAFFTKIGIEPVPLETAKYYPMDSYYDRVEEERGDIELVAIHLLSRSNQILHTDANALSMSQKINSKMHLARNASKAVSYTPLRAHETREEGGCGGRD